MKKKILLTSLMAVSIVGTSLPVYAKFDVSIFEEKDIYEVEIDDMDDTGSIKFNSYLAESDGVEYTGVILGLPGEGTDGVITSEIEIKMVEIDGANIATFRMPFLYSGEDWLFADKLIIKSDENRYTFDVNRVDSDVDGGVVYELYTVVLTSESFQLLEDIANSENENLLYDFRLSGSGAKWDGSFVCSPESFKVIYNDFIEAGGLEQEDLYLISDIYPCTIKSIS